MNKLIQELQRLYLLPEQPWPSAAEPLAVDLVSPDGQVRGMVLNFARAGDWSLVESLYRALQLDLALPAPAIAISGRAGYQVWLSLAASVPVATARSFLLALRDKYLADMLPENLSLSPDAPLCTIPAQDAVSGKWSAFIDPSMGSMFVDAPGLEMAPAMERQADMLHGLKSMTPEDLQRALALFDGVEEGAALGQEGTMSMSRSAPRSAGRDAARLETDPRVFLQMVMNDPAVRLELRIKAAQALLPHFVAAPGENPD